MELSKEVLDIRTNWAIGDAKRDEGLTTPEEIRRYDDITYGPYGRENLLDIYTLKGALVPMPTIISVHGGAWVYGDKNLYQYYCMELARRGFTVVNYSYRLAPESRFPAAVEDLNTVMNFIKENASKYFIDLDNIFMVGDSAGAQIASQYATIITNPEYAKLFEFTVAKVNIKALGLNCGIYDTRKSAEFGLDQVLLEYIGYTNKVVPEEILDKLDTLKYMNDKFPPSYIVSAVNDFLLNQAEPMYNHLKELGVLAEMKIYGSKEREDISHVFHVNCKLDEAQICNDEECEFFKKLL